MKILVIGLIAISKAQIQYTGWGEWSEWGPCSISADYGSRIRHRSCKSVSEQACPGEDYQVEECSQNPVNCIVPPLPANSSFVNCADESYSSGGECEIACYEGFSATGETRIMCTDSGWSAQFGSCVPVPTAQCTPFEDIDHGRVVCSDSFMSSSECLLLCDEGFQATGQSSSICLEHSQDWSNELGTCNEQKCTFEDKEYPPGVSILKDICREKCTCNENGQWRCKEHSCAENAQCVLDIDSSNYECQAPVDCSGTSRSWSVWLNSNTPTNGNERESAQKARKFHPHAGVCKEPDAIESRRKRDGQSASSLVQKGWRIFLGSDKVVCRKRDQIKGKGDCEDMEIRFCCADRDTPPECPEHIGIWSEWANADKNKNDGGDFELLSRHRELSPESVCEVPHSIDLRQVEDTLDWEIKNDQKITTDSQMGLLCYDQANSKDGGCADYEVRFCCSAQSDLSCLRQRPPWTGNRPDPTWLPPDRCCGRKPYNSNQKACCEGQTLVELGEDCTNSTQNSYHY